VTENPKFQMIGEADSPLCETGVCDLPETATAPEPRR
jgi:hypothetical protein